MPDATLNTTADRPSPRRTQRQRRDETRAKLLDATIESLLDVGYVATTTRHVAELAGVSAGAQSHHFQYRVDLVGAAIEELAARRAIEFRENIAALPAEPVERAGALLDLVWADFSSSLFKAFVKVWVAAADDPELHERLRPIERDLAHSITGVLRDMVGDLAGTADWERRLRVVINTLRGQALTDGFEPHDPRGRRDHWPELRQTLLDVVITPNAAAG